MTAATPTAWPTGSAEPPRPGTAEADDLFEALAAPDGITNGRR